MVSQIKKINEESREQTMNIINTHMKKLFLAFCLFISVSPLFAVPDLWTDYQGFKIKKELWVCTSVAFPVDISHDAFNIDYKTVLQNNLGYFIQIKPGEHKDGSVYPDVSAIIKSPVKGVFNTVGKSAGVYEFIFVSMADNFCGLSYGEQAIVRVYLAPQLTGFPVLTNVCPGQSVNVDFNSFIPNEIKYFIDEMGWTIKYKRNGVNVNMPIVANLNTVGNNAYEYYVDDSNGTFAGKYSAMQSTIYACPEDSAILNHTVRIREGEYALPDKEISFCMENLLSVPETWTKMNVNLFGYLGSSVTGGKWSVEDLGGIPASDVSLDENTGDVSLPTQLIDLQIVPPRTDHNLTFKYSYKDCFGTDTATYLKFTFSKDFTMLMSEKEKDVCRNLVSGVVDLSSLFGFSLPLTSGIWYEKIGNDFEEMLYGAVDITDKQSGSLYTFRYDASNANDELCLVEGSSTLLHLRIRDAEVLNAEARICKDLFETGTSVNLFEYVPGLNDPDRVDPTKVTWRDPNGAIISNPENFMLKAEEGQISDSTQTFVYQFDMHTECGTSTGNLYLSTMDSIVVDKRHITINVCFTDDYAYHIDLNQVAGVVGLKGRFVVESTTPAGKDLSGSYNELTGVLNANSAFNVAYAEERYTFQYQPVIGEGDCISSDLKVTIVVTKDLN